MKMLIFGTIMGLLNLVVIYIVHKGDLKNLYQLKKDSKNT